MSWLIIQSLINGLLAGGVYALIAVGVTIIFGVMRVVNFASSAYLVVGMYMTWWLYSLTGLSNYALIPLSILLMVVWAYLTFRLAIIPVLNRDRNATIITTVGLTFFLQNMMILIFGKMSLSVPSPIKTTSIGIGEYTLALPRIIAFCTAVLLVLAVSFLLSKTKIGRAMRATSESKEISEMLGINTNRVFAVAWILGIVMTGIAGALITPIYMVETTVGQVFRTTALMSVVLGGLGDIKGAFLGGIILGIVEAYVSSFVNANLGPAGMFIVFLTVLYFMPNGLFGNGERVA